MKWKDLSVKELRVIAQSYKKFFNIGAVSKISKKDLLVLLDKHLLLDEVTGDVKMKAKEEAPLGRANVALTAKEKRLAKMKAGEEEAKALYAGLKPEIVKTGEQMKGAAADAMEIAKQAMETAKQAMEEIIMIRRKPKSKKSKIPAPPAPPAVMASMGYGKRVKKLGAGKNPAVQMAGASADAIEIAKQAMEHLQMAMNTLEEEPVDEEPVDVKIYMYKNHKFYIDKAGVVYASDSVKPGEATDDITIVYDPELEISSRAEILDEYLETLEPKGMSAKGMTTSQHIQALPQELQNLIYGMLPKDVKKVVEKGTPEEKFKLSLKENKAYATKEWLRFVKDDDKSDFPDKFYDIVSEVQRNFLEYEGRQGRGWESWSEAKRERMMEKTDNDAYEYVFNKTFQKLKKLVAEKPKLSARAVIDRLIDFLDNDTDIFNY